MKGKKLAALAAAAVLTVSAMTGCGVNNNAAIATLGDTKVSVGVFNFILHYNQAFMDDNYKEYFGEDYWNKDLYGAGLPLYESTKESLADTVHDLYTLSVPAHMQEMGVELTAEDNAAITAAAAAFMSANSKEALKEMSASQETVEEMLRLYTVLNRMENAIKDGIAVEVTDEEANSSAYTILQVDKANGMDPETMQALAEMGQDDPTQFESYAQLMGLNPAKGTYSQDEVTLDEEVRTALDALEEGKVSNLIETENAYVLVRLDAKTDAEATEAHRQELINNKKTEGYEEVLSSWQENDGWKINEKEMKTLKFTSYLTTKNGTESLPSTEQ